MNKKGNWKDWASLVLIFLTLCASIYFIYLSDKYKKENDININETMRKIDEINKKLNETNKYLNRTEINIAETAKSTEICAELEKEMKICTDYDSKKILIEEQLECQREACLNKSNNLSLERNEKYYFMSKEARIEDNCSLAQTYLIKIDCANESECGFECYYMEELTIEGGGGGGRYAIKGEVERIEGKNFIVILVEIVLLIFLFILVWFSFKIRQKK